MWAFFDSRSQVGNVPILGLVLKAVAQQFGRRIAASGQKQTLSVEPFRLIPSLIVNTAVTTNISDQGLPV